MVYPHVFQVSYEDDHYHRVDTCGGMDSEYSHTTRENNTELVVAPDLETAKFLWAHRCRGLKSRTNIKWETLGAVSLLFTGGYGF